MKDMRKLLVAACVVALSGAMFAGCSSQQPAKESSEPASSAPVEATSAAVEAPAAGTQADLDALIAELEAVPSLAEAKSVTIEFAGNIALDMDQMAAAAAGSESTSTSELGKLEIPIAMTIMAEGTQEAGKIYMDAVTMGVPFQLYMTGENAVLVMNGEAYAGTLADFGMEQYSSMDAIMASNGNIKFDDYKAAIKSITKESVDGNSVYSVEVDPTLLAGQDAMNALSQLGLTGDAFAMNLTYIIGADGKVAESSVSISSPGFALDEIVLMHDYDTTVVPNAPEATKTAEDFQAAFAQATEQAAA